MQKTLLINCVYHKAVGHCIEALRYTLGYHTANPNWEISLILNKQTPYELADCCPWISNTYTVDLHDKAEVNSAMFQHIPSQWDYVVSKREEKGMPTSLKEYYKHAQNYFLAKESKDIVGADAVPYAPHTNLELELPETSQQWASSRLKNTNLHVGLLFAGHKQTKFFPSIESWKLILNALNEQYNHNVSFYLFGALGDGQGRSTSGITEDDLTSVLQKFPNAVNCFDKGIFNQLALAKHCNVFISPHSGFAFAIQAVGTPWLTISGGRWPEHFFNGVPFVSILPDRKKYPVYDDIGAEEPVLESDRSTIPAMSKQRIREDLPHILSAADSLIHNKWTYEECLQNHFSKMRKYYGHNQSIWSFDNVHAQYMN